MATIFDIVLFEQLAVLFGWIFILIVTYGIMEITNVFHNKSIHAIIAVSVTVIIATTSSLFEVVIRMVPWLVILGVFFLFLMILGQSIGLSQGDVLQNLGGKGAMWIVLVPLLIVLIISLVGEARETLDEGEPDETLNAGRVIVETLTDPKILGFMLIIIISTLTIAFMAGAPPVAHH